MVQEMSFKRFLIWSYEGPPVQWSKTIYAILKEGIMWNIHVKLYEIGPVVQEEMSFKEKVYGRRMIEDGCTTKTDHNTSPWAFGSGELKSSHSIMTELEFFFYIIGVVLPL